MKEECDPRLDAKGKRLPVTACPNCGSPNDAATLCDERAEEESRPRPGDLSVCIRCGVIVEFTEAMRLRTVDLDSREDIDDDNKFQLRHIQQKIRQINMPKQK